MSLWLAIGLAFASVGEHRGADRPLPLGVPSVLSDDGRFRVHWSLDPALAPPGAEEGEVPPGVEVVFDAIAIAEEAYRLRGYEPVVPDDGTGGDDALDVYFVPIDANGYAYPLRGQSPEGGPACYIELDSGLRGDTLASVVQHELHHCVQFRYTTRAAGWIYEASATYEQYRLASDSLDLGLQILYAARITRPDRPLDHRGDRYEYAGMLVFRHLEEYRRPADRSVGVWRALAVDPDWYEAIDRVTTESFDLPIEEWFATYSTYNAFACGASDGLHYDESFLPCTSPATAPRTPIEDGVAFDVQLADTPLTSAVFELPSDGAQQDLLLDCDAPASGRWLATLTGVDAEGVGPRTVRSTPSDEGGTLRWTGGVDDGGSMRVVVASVGEDPLDLQCTASWAPQREAPTSSCAVVSRSPLGAAGLCLLALMTLGRPRRPGRT